MAFSHMDIAHFISLSKIIPWQNIKKICDIGNQEINAAGSSELIFEFIKLCAPDTSISIEDIAPFSHHAYMSDIWNLAGIEYICLDVLGGDKVTMFDLNFDQVPDSMKEQFDIVFNYGTTEHVFNQYNSFKTIHDLTKPSGFMLHCVPMSGFHNHGLFNYNMKFFTQLGKSNYYNLRDSFLTVDPDNYKIERSIVNIFNQDKFFLKHANQSTRKDIRKVFHSRNSGPRVVFQKYKQSRPFKIPNDLCGQNDIFLTEKNDGRLVKVNPYNPYFLYHKLKMEFLQFWHSKITTNFR